MAFKFDALIIDVSHNNVKRLTESLWPEIQFATADYANSINDGFQKLIDLNYNIAFIHESFDRDLDSFFRDMKKLGRDKSCCFVQIRDKLFSEDERLKTMDLGFASVINRDISSDDRAVLKEILQLEIRHQEIARRVGDVTEAMRFIIKELDRVAAEHQRGRPERFDTMIRNFVRMLTEYDDEVMELYLDALCDKTTEAPTPKQKKVAIPESVLKRKLPHLSGDRYSGQSRRVWLKLLKRYGVTDQKETPRAKAASPEPKPGE